jgi:hypothetical protein
LVHWETHGPWDNTILGYKIHYLPLDFPLEDKCFLKGKIRINKQGEKAFINKHKRENHITYHWTGQTIQHFLQVYHETYEIQIGNVQDNKQICPMQGQHACQLELQGIQMPKHIDN